MVWHSKQILISGVYLPKTELDFLMRAVSLITTCLLRQKDISPMVWDIIGVGEYGGRTARFLYFFPREPTVDHVALLGVPAPSQKKSYAHCFILDISTSYRYVC